MTTTTTSLTAFLLDRIAEDEAEIGLAIYGHDNSAGPNGIGWAEVGAISEVLMVSHRRGLAECASKRSIVEYATGHHTSSPEGMDIARVLAEVYADHPDYDPAWAVS